MKIVRINESQKRRLFEAYSDGFSFETLTMIGEGQFGGEDNSNTQFEYCRKFLGEPDSFGTSRCVFTLNDGLVLKLAYGRADVGVEQNHSEANLFRAANSPLLAKIYACDENNYTWLVSEAALPARAEDFEKVFGIPFGKVYKQNSIRMRKGASPDKGDNDIGFNKYFDNIKAPGEERNDGITMTDIFKYIVDRYFHKTPLYNVWLKSVIENGGLSPELAKWVKELIRLVESGQIADIGAMNNYGVVNREGKPQIVLLDSGATMNILKKYYTR